MFRKYFEHRTWTVLYVIVLLSTICEVVTSLRSNLGFGGSRQSCKNSVLNYAWTDRISAVGENQARCGTRLQAQKKSKEGQNLGGTAATQKLFSLAEVFGEITSIFRPENSEEKEEVAEGAREINNSMGMKLTKEGTEQIAAQIKEEYEAIFWATGNMDTSLWADDCTFKDPFSSFGGKGSTLRFKKNADNLGKLVLNPTMKITSFNIDYLSPEKKSENTADISDIKKDKFSNIVNSSSACVRVGWIFSSKLNFPWKPILAAAGETFHYLDTTSGRISLYEETWKSDPWDVVKRLFTPSKNNK